MSAVVEKTANPIAEVRYQLNNMEDQFKAALPAHIPAERFMRVVMTAVQNNPDLLKADRRSLWNSAMKAAQDGLLPDGREGAMVVYGNKVQWMPMIAGIRKKVRNSGEIATWDAHVVYENDSFEFELGDEPFIRHKPALDNPGKVVAAYAIATLKSGEKSREVMSITAIEKVRQRSKAARSGPWVTDYEEMCRKTVARRHSKVLPMSTDLDDLVRRDDDLYDFRGAAEAAQGEDHARPRGLAGRLDALANDAPKHDPETGEIEDERPDSRSGALEADQDGAGAMSEALNYEELIEELRADFASATTEEQLLELSDDASEAWFNDAPKAFREQASDLFEEQRKRLRKASSAGLAQNAVTKEEPPEIDTSVITDPAMKKLYADAMAEARKGHRKLTWWLGKLNAPDHARLEPYLDDLKEVAERAAA